MSKLSKEEKFLDLSDYGRSTAKFLAERLKNTSVTPIQVTICFGICGLIAIYCILNNHFYAAGFFLIWKSIIDAMDGELSRIKQTPSYTGRYLDSVFDIILNFMILMAIASISTASFWLTLLAFVCVQLQGTLYNYYYVILRNNSVGGDTTSKIFETETPTAMAGESQRTVSIMFAIFVALYGVYDRVIYALDANAYKERTFPSWFMTIVSCYGLGFQLLLIALMLALGLVNYVIPFFIFYTILLPILIIIRRTFLVGNLLAKM